MVMKKATVQKIAWGFAASFAFGVAIAYIPFIRDDNGRIFGFFRLDFTGNLLHVLSGTWAAAAAWHSRNASLYYFRIFGTAYLLDGLVGIVAGKAYLNLNIFNPNTDPVADVFTRVVLNAPHVVIGGSAMYVGFVLYRKLSGPQGRMA